MVLKLRKNIIIDMAIQWPTCHLLFVSSTQILFSFIQTYGHSRDQIIVGNLTSSVNFLRLIPIWFLTYEKKDQKPYLLLSPYLSAAINQQMRSCIPFGWGSGMQIVKPQICLQSLWRFIFDCVSSFRLSFLVDTSIFMKWVSDVSFTCWLFLWYFFMGSVVLSLRLNL